MERVVQIVFIISLLGLCWLGMMAVHELGHVVAAWLTGGEVVRVVLHPLTISRTDLGVNPHPLIVVWAGPLAGVLLPLIIATACRFANVVVLRYAQCFAGFCLIANGVYIAGGLFDRIGDCGVMLRHGTPPWVMLLFGAITVPMGLLFWHRLGSLREFWKRPESVPPSNAYFALVTLLVVALVEAAFSPR